MISHYPSSETFGTNMQNSHSCVMTQIVCVVVCVGICVLCVCVCGGGVQVTGPYPQLVQHTPLNSMELKTAMFCLCYICV